MINQTQSVLIHIIALSLHRSNLIQVQILAARGSGEGSNETTYDTVPSARINPCKVQNHKQFKNSRTRLFLSMLEFTNNADADSTFKTLDMTAITTTNCEQFLLYGITVNGNGEYEI